MFQLTKPNSLPELRACLKLAMPLIASQLTESATGFVDTIMMGWLGSDAIAAGGLGAITFSYLLWISSSLLSAVSPLVAQAHGAGNHQQVRQIVQQGLFLAVLIGIPIAFLLWFIQPLLLALGQDAETVAMTKTYLQAIAWGFVPALGFAVLKNFVCALFEARPVMLIVIFGTLLNIIGNDVLMFGKLGFPALGLAGIGWSSTLSLWSMFLALGFYIVRRPSLAMYQIWTGYKFHPVFQELLQIGLPIAGLMAVEAGIYAVITLFAGQLGTTALAAHQIVYQTASVLSAQVAYGISIATTIRVGHYMGQERPDRARDAGYMGIILAGLCMSGFSLIFLLAPRQITALYLDPNPLAHQDVVALTTQLLSVAAVFQMIDGVQIAAAGALRGLKDTNFPMWVGTIAYWGISLPIAYLLGMKLGMGAVGLWWGSAVGLAIAAVALTWRFSVTAAQISRWSTESSSGQILPP
jgi:multidrug resistance protein, MATE family